MTTLQLLLIALAVVFWIITMALAWRAGAREGARSNPAYFLGRHDGYHERHIEEWPTEAADQPTVAPKEKYSDHSNLHVIG